MSEPAPVQVPTSKGISPKQIIGAIIVVLALIFVFQNSATRSVHFLFWKMSMPTWIWLLIVFIAGIAVGLLLPRMRARSKKKDAKREAKQNASRD